MTAKLGRLALALSILTAAACGIIEPSGPHSQEQSRLTEARRLWRSQGLSDYSYVFSRSCFCVFEYREPVTITVRGGNIASVVSVASGSPRDASTYHTIDGLFDQIQRAITEDAASIRAEYDRTRGHPTSVYIDLDQRIADEEISFETTGLTPSR